MPINGKTAVVTGAGKGIGREISLLLARNGVHVVAAARTAVEVEQLIDEIHGQGGTGLAVSVDIRKSNEVEDLVSRAVKRFGEIDILVNNAGVGTFVDVEGDLFQSLGSIGRIHLVCFPITKLRSRAYSFSERPVESRTILCCI